MTVLIPSTLLIVTILIAVLGLVIFRSVKNVETQVLRNLIPVEILILSKAGLIPFSLLIVTVLIAILGLLITKIAKNVKFFGSEVSDAWYTGIQVYRYTGIHTYIHACMHAQMHVCMHT